MLLPISVNLCCFNFGPMVFQNYSMVLYSCRRNVLLPISENLCCLDLNHDGIHLDLLSYTSAERIAEWTPMSLYHSLYSWQKSEQVSPKRCFSHKRLLQIFFFIYTSLLFLSCKYQLLCLLKTNQFLVIHKWSRVFLNNFIIVTWFSFLDWSLKQQLILATSVFLQNFVTPFYLFLFTLL